MDNKIFITIFILVILTITTILYFYIRRTKSVKIANRILVLSINYLLCMFLIYFVLRKFFNVVEVSFFIPVIAAIPFYYLSSRYLSKGDK